MHKYVGLLRKKGVLPSIRPRAVAALTCRRCDQPAAVRVDHAQLGVRVYCLQHFRRLGDVPPGSAITWARRGSVTLRHG
ncbi:MAG TPA: hypothetical protein VHX59_04885 [Mycobacteriales bacterium]|jgi:hypothetical protein|nr:hypothetical protein [Mycobacteriales bacterium]